MSDLSTQQIKLTLPGELYFFLKSKADRFGMTLSSYVKNLVIDDVKDLEMPVFPMSEATEKRGLEALKAYRAGKTRSISNIKEYFDKL